LVDRLFEQFLVRAHAAKLEVGLRVLRIDADGLPAFLGGLFIVLLLAKGVRPIAQGELAVFRPVHLPQLVRLAKLLNRLVEQLLVRKHAATVVVRTCLVWIGGHRAENFPLRILVGWSLARISTRG